MIYSVVPRELESELLERLSEHYADDPNVTVIVDRRHGERRQGSDPAHEQRRTLRDRRRRRVPGEFAALEGDLSVPA